MSKGQRQRSNARGRLAEERARQAAQARRTRAMLITAGAGVLIILVVIVVVLVRSSGEDRQVYAGPVAPVTRQPDGSTVMAVPGVTRPVLEIFEDFQCPACKAFETTNGGNTKKLAALGNVRVVYRPFTLFTMEPLKSNSERAANAALCAPANKWIRYHDLLYKKQPAEGTVGFLNKDLIAWAGQVGITGDAFAACVNGNQKAAQAQQMTQYALNVGKVKSTPNARLNGREMDQSQVFTSDGFQKAILAAERG
jgi:protein-disulfide isomerase